MKMNTGPVKMFQQFPILNLRGKPFPLQTPRVMGILNVTPDSFYDGGKFTDLKAIVRHAGKLIREGASIIDIGAQSTRPGAKSVGPATELKRLLPAIKAILERYPDTLLSVDTYHAQVADAAVEAGAAMINDVSGGQFDRDMFKTAGRLQVPYVLMHMAGTPETMQKRPVYKDVTSSVLSYFGERIAPLRKAGVKDILLDPGFGFGKTAAHNFTLLRNLDVFRKTGFPVLAGMSRKSMIYKTLGVLPKDSLNGTTALHMVALERGASLLRVHDVKQAMEAVWLYEQLQLTR